MMTCREVSMLVSTGGLADAPMARRLGARMHLAMCRHCGAFKRRIEAIGRAARDAGRGFEGEPASDFETRILARLGR